MSVFFIADTHFGDSRIRSYENRPFSNTTEMDETMIRNWNDTVSADDTVWHLGDFGADGHEAETVCKLNGHIRLVKGNHDVQSSEYYRRCGFEEVYDMPVILDSFWMLSHEPLYVCTNMPYADIFGHVHASPLFRDYSRQHFCVSAERIRYRPISFDAIKAAVLG